MALVKYNNNSLSAITSTGLDAGAMTLIKSQTASSSSTISFVHGTSDVVLDSTYPIYLFKFININPSADEAEFLCNGSIDAGSNYNVTKSTSAFSAYHQEDDSSTGVGYVTGEDLAQSTSAWKLAYAVGNAADESNCGEMWLFNPSSTTYVKHFISVSNEYGNGDLSYGSYAAGYFNVTTALTRFQFKMSSGNIDAGTIKLYGIS